MSQVWKLTLSSNFNLCVYYQAKHYRVCKLLIKAIWLILSFKKGQTIVILNGII